MLRMIFFILLLAVSILLTGCGNLVTQRTNIQNTTKTVKDVVSEQTKRPSLVKEVSPNAGNISVVDIDKVYPSVDIDLTTFSSTRIYDEVSNIMSAPKNYIGKTIKMQGTYVQYSDGAGTMVFPTCMVTDATACYQQGIEFTIDDNNFPKKGSNIIVAGIFDSYTDKYGYTYFYLKNAVWKNN